MMTDVTNLPAGGFVAIGYVPPDWQPVSWTSADGSTWSLHSMGTTDFTFPVALASGSDGTVVAVGRSGNAPVAWTTTDGGTWEHHAFPVLNEVGIAERLMTVVAGPDGYVAGGSAPVQEQGEFYAITPGGPGAIAVGSYGAPDSYLPTVWLTPSR